MLVVGVARRAVLAGHLTPLYSAPNDPPPDGFAWEDLKEVHAWMLRPAGWLFRRATRAPDPTYDFVPQAFEGEGEPNKGLTVKSMRKVKDQTGKLADEYAASCLAGVAAGTKVLNLQTKTGEPPGPFTTYVLMCIGPEDDDGMRLKCKYVLVANRETDTLCWFELWAPVHEWKDVERWGDTMLANLRLDPKF